MKGGRESGRLFYAVRLFSRRFAPPLNGVEATLAEKTLPILMVAAPVMVVIEVE